jgi:ankyrin repeat protein
MMSHLALLCVAIALLICATNASTNAPTFQPTSVPTSEPTNLIYNANQTLVSVSSKDVNSAVFSGSVSAVVEALKAYSSDKDTNNVKYTAITSAIFANEPTMVDVVIKAVSMDVNKQGEGSGNSFLMWACHWGKQVIAESLIKQGADLTLKNKEGDTALSLAAKGNVICAKEWIYFHHLFDIFLKIFINYYLLCFQLQQLDTAISSPC